MSTIEKGYTGVIKSVSELDDNGNLNIAEIYPKNRDRDVFVRRSDVYGGDNKNYTTTFDVLYTFLGKFNNYLSRTSPNAKSHESGEAEYVRDRIKYASSAETADVAYRANKTLYSTWTYYNGVSYNNGGSYIFKSDIRRSYDGNTKYPYGYADAKTTYLKLLDDVSKYLTTASYASSASYSLVAGRAECDGLGNSITATYYTTADKISTANLSKKASTATSSIFCTNSNEGRYNYITSASYSYSSDKYEYSVTNITKPVRSDLVLRFVGCFDGAQVHESIGKEITILTTSSLPLLMSSRFLIFLGTNAYNINADTNYKGIAFEYDVSLAIPYNDGTSNLVKVRSIISPQNKGIIPWRYKAGNTGTQIIEINTLNKYTMYITTNSNNTYSLILRGPLITGGGSGIIPGTKFLIFQF